ncbi:mediator of RNA polymerase II transcription subunit 8 [Cladorrhinum sp. PSN332]|nr:mediator of RNA polymerase II transcription subunit 8 [Cladorrhinum sp. PSN332]
MASLNLAPEELKQVEMVRNRLNQLFHGLESLTQRLIHSTPLPTRESLQANTTIIQKNIMSIQSIIDENFELFQRVAVQPSTNYPGRNSENFDLLIMLLRKKPEEAVDDLMEESMNAARAAGLDEKKLAVGLHERRNSYDDDPDDYGLDDEEEEGQSDPFSEQWADCLYTFNQALTQYVTVQVRKNFTVEEQAMGIENVRTGLKRELKDLEDDDDEDDEDEDEDEDMEMGGTGSGVGAGFGGGSGTASGANPNAQPEQLLWMLCRGGRNLPRVVELDANRVVKVETKRAPPPR